MKHLKGIAKRAANVLGIEQKLQKRDSDYSNVNYLLHLIQARKWRSVRKVLNSKSGEKVCQETDSTSLSPLGAAVGCNAPYDIIQKILKLYPDAILTQDEYGSIPLHFCCLNNSPEEVIDLILNHELGKAAVMTQDKNGYTPLHHSLQCICSFIRDERQEVVPDTKSNGSDENNSSALPPAWLCIQDDIFIDSMISNSLGMIERLCAKAPECVLLSTNYGETAMDLVQEKRVYTKDEDYMDLLSDIYYNLLQQAAVHTYKNNKIQWESEGYDTEVHNVELDNFSTCSSSSSSRTKGSVDSTIPCSSSDL